MTILFGHCWFSLSWCMKRSLSDERFLFSSDARRLCLQKWLLPRVQPVRHVIDSRTFSSGLHRLICKLVLVVVECLSAVLVQELVCSCVIFKNTRCFCGNMNFVIFPVFFLSGSLYPITNLCLLKY